jgi:hypothetical protein
VWAGGLRVSPRELLERLSRLATPAGREESFRPGGDVPGRRQGAIGEEAAHTEQREHGRGDGDHAARTGSPDRFHDGRITGRDHPGRRAARRHGLRRPRQSALELLKPVPRSGNVGGGRRIDRPAGALARGEKLHQRMRLAQREHLALAELANQGLSRERRAAQQGAKGDLGAVPALNDVGGDVFGVTSDVESGDDRPNVVQRRERRPLVRCRHLTIRSNPASALPRMKLSGSVVAMSIPVTAYCRRASLSMNS